MTEKEKIDPPWAERRVTPPVDKHELLHSMIQHAQECPNTLGLKELNKEVQELWKKVMVIEILDNRVSAVEDAVDTMVSSIAIIMADLHKIQTSMAENNVLRLWVGRIIIGTLSAAIAFFTAKYT
jgi:hypothetical protein